MKYQPSFVQVNITPRDPNVGKHWSEIDTDHLAALRMYALSRELHEAGAQIPVAKLFLLEALGYSVDLETGVVSNE